MDNAFRRALLGAGLLVLAAGSLQAEELKVGNTYRDSVQLTQAMGGVILPLPTGEWQLIALGQSRSAQTNVPMVSGRFASAKLDTKKQPHMLITFVVSTDVFSGGWKVPELCQDRGTHFKVPADRGSNRDYKNFQCLAIKEQTMKPAPQAEQWLKDSYEWIGKNSVGMPLTTLQVTYFHGDGPKFLRADYAFNPERDGLPRQGATEWNRDRIISNPKKVAYVENLKAWGEKWAPKVDAGFNGKAP